MITPERLKEIIFNCYSSYFDEKRPGDGIEYLATALLDKFEIREKGGGDILDKLKSEVEQLQKDQRECADFVSERAGIMVGQSKSYIVYNANANAYHNVLKMIDRLLESSTSQQAKE